MEREVPEEFTGSNDHTQIVKGKRTKRQRPPSPFAMALTSSSSTGGGRGGHSSGGGGGGERDAYFSSPSPTTSGEISTSSVEDEDMANCLILLAQGSCPTKVEDGIKIEKFSSRRFAEMSSTTTAKAGFYVYDCKTCNRTFPSFQALGGHRASHKKPKALKATDEEKKFLTPPLKEEKEGQFTKISPSFTIPIANNKPKVHECTICGSEFSSGQALGGHMRRHRTHPTSRIAMSTDMSTIESTHESEKPRNILPLDLNLPAPEEDRGVSNFQFTPNQQHLVFSAPALVGCHY